MSCGKSKQLPGHALFQAVDAGDAVANGNHRAGLGEFDLADIPFDLALDDLTDFCRVISATRLTLL